MLVPDHIRYAAEEANLAVVEAYLDEAGPGAVNRQDEYGETILVSSLNSSIEEGHVQFARRLIARGADVNIASRNGSVALLLACYPGECASAMVSLLLQAGARVNVRWQDCNPLGTLIEHFDYCVHALEDKGGASEASFALWPRNHEAPSEGWRLARPLREGPLGRSCDTRVSISPPKLRQRRVLRQVPRTRGRRPRARQLQGLCARAASPVPPPPQPARPGPRQGPGQHQR